MTTIMNGRDFRTWREAAGLSQADVAAATGVSVADISRYEKGRYRVAAEVAERLEQMRAALTEDAPTESTDALDHAASMTDAEEARPRCPRCGKPDALVPGRTPGYYDCIRCGHYEVAKVMV